MKKLFLVLFLIINIISVSLAGSKYLRHASEGSGNVPKFFLSKYLGMIFRMPTFFTSMSTYFLSDVKVKTIARLLTKEAQTGSINKYVNKLFFELDEKTAMMVGPKIAEFRKQGGNRNQIIKDINNCARLKKNFGD